jgi:hypothetical protein
MFPVHSAATAQPRVPALLRAGHGAQRLRAAPICIAIAACGGDDARCAANGRVVGIGCNLRSSIPIGSGGVRLALARDGGLRLRVIVLKNRVELGVDESNDKKDEPHHHRIRYARGHRHLGGAGAPTGSIFMSTELLSNTKNALVTLAVK